jgi:RHS repeat-associated protein
LVCVFTKQVIKWNDERFNFVGENNTVVRVDANNNSSLTLPNIKAPKNGYAYIYLNNESDIPVYFDNFNIAYTRGRIIEENHYYAFGLKIAGISSKKLGDANEGSLKNNNLYNDQEIDDEADLDWLDYGFRNYDPQIGRFVQIDPLTDDYQALSNYHYALNDPILNIDLWGLSSGNVLQQVACAGEKIHKANFALSSFMSIGVNIAKIGTAIGNYQFNSEIGNGGPGDRIAGFLTKRWQTFKSNWSYVGNSISSFTKEKYRIVRFNILMESARTKTSLTERVIREIFNPLNSIIPEEAIFEEYFLRKYGVKLADDVIKKEIDILKEYEDWAISRNWMKEDGTPIYPANDDFEGVPEKTTLKPGDRFDRFGSPKGSFASPTGTPLAERSLPSSVTGTPVKYRVIKPIENVQSGKIAPWFGQPGGGIQYKLPKSIEQLKAEKYIEEIP